jgi:phosphate transport system substrate-binding protein
MKLSRSFKIAAAAAAVTLFAAQPAFAGITITGSGSTFASPLIAACAPGWQSSTGYTVNYLGGGSGGGRKNADAGINDFNFSDASYTPAKSTTLHIPVVAAPVAIAYNLNGASGDLYLSQKTLSDIFAGNITKWNDPAIVADNNKSTSKSTVVYKKDAKGALVKDKKTKKPIVLKTVTSSSSTPTITLPNQPISVIYRADSSGTTQNLVNMFIAQFPSTWTKASSGAFSSVFPGASIPLSWSSASGSAGVSALAANTPYSITYVEASFAAASKLGQALIKNAAGNFQGPTAGGTASFLNSATATSTGVLTFNYNTTDPGAYVLGIVSYALVDTNATGAYASASTSFMKYLLTDACVNANPSLQYSSISGSLLAIDKALIAKLPQ